MFPARAGCRAAVPAALLQLLLCGAAAAAPAAPYVNEGTVAAVQVPRCPKHKTAPQSASGAGAAAGGTASSSRGSWLLPCTTRLREVFFFLPKRPVLIDGLTPARGAWPHGVSIVRRE